MINMHINKSILLYNFIILIFIITEYIVLYFTLGNSIIILLLLFLKFKLLFNKTFNYF